MLPARFGGRLGMGAEPFRSMIEGSVALATTVAEAPVRHDLLQLAETAMKEVLAAGNHDYRKVLRSRPLENRSKRHDVVLIPVHDERVLRYELCVDAIDCRSDQGKPLSLKLVHDSRLHICTEGEASEQDRQVAKPSAQMLDQHNQIVGLAYALVVNALGCAYSTEVRPHRTIPKIQLNKILPFTQDRRKRGRAK